MSGKKPTPRAAGPAHVLRHVDLHSEPRSLPGRGRQALPGTAAASPTVAGAARAALLPPAEARAAAAPNRGPDPQWQAGHRQGFLEGREAGLEQARQQQRDSQAEEGFQEGYEAGLLQAREHAAREAAELAKKIQHAADEAVKKARHDSAQQLQRLDQMLRALPEQLAARMASMEDDMVELCFTALCRLLGERLVTPAGVRAFVAQASKDWPADADLAVHLHPNDLELLRAAPADDFVDSSRQGMLADLTAELERRVRPPVQWVADPAMGAGGCVLRSSKGGLDARLATQMASLVDLLLEVRGQRRGLRHPMDSAAVLNLAGLEPQQQAAAPAPAKGQSKPQQAAKR